MVMTDPLCWAKEDALKYKNTHLMTIATLTGHAVLALGPYTAVVDNGPARKENFSLKIQRVGEGIGDMMDISSLRREDLKFIKSTGVGEDLLQCNNAASSRTPRGHQFPAAFMMVGAGLDKYGSESETPLKYTHFDIAGAAGEVPFTPSGVPILALSRYFFGDQFSF
ncbi:putative aminopeptidase W07G4.4 [Orchesella cincta]|uniref:Putative aminopeptidase W07G4.4 n=1 Tax=Orchesella cincta TaxID=48709 RepID=A0A1D2MYU7_ORCCI|nr:putative aminopeptidase W07G4.4 [Orchesella cincta]